jgi:hypothetical protein
MVTMVWVVSRIQVKGPFWYSIFLYHHPPHRDNVTLPHGRPNLRSQLHFSHNQKGDHKFHDGHVVALENNNNNRILIRACDPRQNALLNRVIL